MGLSLRKMASWAFISILFFNVFSAAAIPGLYSTKSNAASSQVDNAEVLIICTSNGLKQVRLDANGEPVPVDDDPKNNFCPFCLPFSKIFLSAPAAKFVSSPHAFVRFRQPVSCEAEVIVASFTLSPLGSRAPPVSSI